MFYRVYKYSNKATLISLLFRLIAFIFGVMAIGLFQADLGIAVRVAGIVIFAALAVYFWVCLSGTLSDKIAEKDFAVKIKTSANVAYLYCKDNPEEFEKIAAENPAFAEKYCKNEKGKIVKIK
ncbi:MAG: hypothetical protein LUG91_04290 [Ruminococcus sp.]|nr:hypothetical protein [Ruminococcus sp.]